MRLLRPLLNALFWTALVLAFFAGVAIALVVNAAIWVFNLPGRLMGWNK